MRLQVVMPKRKTPNVRGSSISMMRASIETDLDLPCLLYCRSLFVMLSCSFVQYTGSSIWKSWIQPSVLETFYGILKLSLVLNHPIGWEHWLLGKKIDIPAQFDDKEWVFWSLLFLWKLKFDWFSVFLKSSFLFKMRINDQI